MKQRAVVLGATGLVGTELVNLLLEDTNYEEVITFVRNKTLQEHPKLTQRAIDFSEIENQNFQEKPTVFYCCIGTTIKKAKSKEAFEIVDYQYPLQFAQLAQKMNVETYVVISALGANAKSRVFYSRTKGNLEKALEAMNFNQLLIMQPALLLGNRKEFRFGEKLGEYVYKYVPFLSWGKLSNYRPIHAVQVAFAMKNGVACNLSGKISNKEMQKMSIHGKNFS